jgi:hypothetical protein
MPDRKFSAWFFSPIPLTNLLESFPIFAKTRGDTRKSVSLTIMLQKSQQICVKNSKRPQIESSEAKGKLIHEKT